MSNNNNKNNNRNNYKNNNYNKKNQNKQTGMRRTVEVEQVKKQNVENTKEVEKETVAEPKAAEVKAQPEKISKAAKTENRIDVNELKDKLTNVLNRKNTRIVLVSAAKIVLPVIALIIVVATDHFPGTFQEWKRHRSDSILIRGDNRRNRFLCCVK